MAVDIKSLRIGSHVLVNGIRARVVQLNTISWGKKPVCRVWARGASPEDGVVREVGCFTNDEAVEPIAITPELLKELGFKYRTPICIWIKASEDEYLSFERICGTNRWRIHIYIGNEDRGKCVCRYLHEAEAFLALHGIELIPTDMAGFKTPLQERAEREIFSKDKDVANKAMEILLDEADRMIEAHHRTLPYQLLLASRAMMEREIKFDGRYGFPCERSV